MLEKGKATVVLGSQFGDEGKGKIIDILSESFEYVCRAQGGSNAGHTVVVNGNKHSFHILPSGLLHEKTLVLIGNGVVIHVPSLISEIEKAESSGIKNVRDRIIISDRAHIVCDFHQIVDRYSDTQKGKDSIGTTGKGIGPTYSCKMLRSGVRMCDLINDLEYFNQRILKMHENYKKEFPNIDHNIQKELEQFSIYRQTLVPMVKDTTVIVNEAILNGKSVLIEGANAHLLDIDFGTYPYVTSSNCTIGGTITGLGIPPNRIGPIIGVMKAYCSRVGFGPFPTELTDEIGEHLIEKGNEYGTTTGRRRRCGWLDLVMIRSCDLINNFSSFAITKLDVLDGLSEIKIATHYMNGDEKITIYPAFLNKLNNVTVVYKTFKGWKTSVSCATKRSELPQEAIEYIDFIEKEINKKITSIGVGRERNNIIY